MQPCVGSHQSAVHSSPSSQSVWSLMQPISGSHQLWTQASLWPQSFISISQTMSSLQKNWMQASPSGQGSVSQLWPQPSMGLYSQPPASGLQWSMVQGSSSSQSGAKATHMLSMHSGAWQASAGPQSSAVSQCPPSGMQPSMCFHSQPIIGSQWSFEQGMPSKQSTGS